jgi:hypothetical protein
MSKLEIFDPAMCCSTGVCGPSVDPELLRVSTIVNILNKKGFNVVRHNLSQEPQAFVQNQLVSELLKTKGSEALPITLLDGKVVKSGSYPSRKELAEWLNIEVSELSSAIITKKHKGCSEDEQCDCNNEKEEPCCSNDKVEQCCGDKKGCC